MDTKVIRSTLLFLLLVLGVKGTHKATVDVTPASTDTTAVLQCYTYGISYPECFPWPQYYDPDEKNCTTVWMKDEQILRSDDRFDITSRVTYNFCDTFPDTSKLYTLVSGLELPEGGIIKDFDIYKGFACFVSTLTIKEVQESDFGIYHCNYSDHRPLDSWRQFQHLANVTLVETNTDYTPPEPKVELVVNNNIEGTNEKERLAQCISVGTPLDWYYVLGQTDMDTTSCDTDWGKIDLECRFKRFGTKLSSLVSEDMWRCFEFTNVTQQPYSYDVYESFLFFNNFCRLDALYVFCGSADGGIGDTAHVVQVINPNDESESWHMGDRRENGLKIAAGLVIFIVGSLLIGFSIWACSRITCNRKPAPISL